METFLAAINEAKKHLQENSNSASSTRDIIERLPRITTRFNVAKRQLINAFSDYINEVDKGEEGLSNLATSVKNVLLKLK